MGPRAGLDGRKISSSPGFLFLFISSNTGQFSLSKLSEEHCDFWMQSEIQVKVNRTLESFEIVNTSQALKFRVPSLLYDIPYRHHQVYVYQYMSRTVM